MEPAPFTLTGERVPMAPAVNPGAISETWEHPAVAAVRGASGPVVLDLDETLWLRNSTEEYLDSIRPRWLVAAVLMVLRILPVWRLFGTHDDAEDWFRLLVCSVLFPWALPMWRRRVRRAGPRWLNPELADAVALRPAAAIPVVVATRGFLPVVRPLVESFGLGPVDLVACRSWAGRADRRAGKLAMLEERYGSAWVEAAVVVTDSETDRTLLDRCAVPVLCTWPDALYEPTPRTYAPFAYTELYKRKGQRYVFHIILVGDVALWAIATTTVAPMGPLWHLTGLALLAVSFWCVYDIGYLENDRVAERYEDDPVVPDRALPGRTYEMSAWLWALGTGVAGVAILRPGEFAKGMALWLVLLLGLRLAYLLYNHLDKASRPIIYVVLQSLRLLAPLAVVPVASAGIIALLLCSWSRALQYATYRALRSGWVIVPHGLIDLTQLVIAYIILGRIGVRLEPVVMLAMVVWLGFLARGEVRQLLRGVHFVHRPGPRSPAPPQPHPDARRR
ncbi:MAG TPA: HAD family hydrolase [Ilumatobacteraceae bacterium]|nr:HAD family hydrolase [Ilumatobacteraceae bacterium]